MNRLKCLRQEALPGAGRVALRRQARLRAGPHPVQGLLLAEDLQAP